MTTNITPTKTKNLKLQRPVAVSLIAVLLLAVMSGIVFADTPPQIPAYYNGDIVHFTVVSDNVVDVNHPGIHKAAAILYAFGPPEDQPQFDILDTIPGDPGYNPWWHVIFVVVLPDGRDVTVNPYTSEAEILAAADSGEVALIDSGIHFLCQVLP
jgi:hypothetical protein